jgi:hypothetical protein
MDVKRCSKRLVRIGNSDTICRNMWESGTFPLGSSGESGASECFTGYQGRPSSLVLVGT